MTDFDPLIKNAVNVGGNPEAPQTLVFLHGFGTDQSAWKDVAPAFAKDFRIVLLDNVGAGKSDPAAFVQHRYLNLRTYAQDLGDVCAALELENVILVGHSVGAMIAILAVLRDPLRVSRLVLIGASPRYVDDADYRGGMTRDDLNELYRCVENNYPEWADRCAPAAMLNPDRPHLAEHFAATLKAIPRAHALTTLCAIFQSDHRDDLQLLDLPTLIIQSQDDVAVPREVAEYLHRHIKGSRLAMIEGSGHFPHISAPAEIIRAMNEFFRSEI